jgi:hypothetical protein
VYKWTILNLHVEVTKDLNKKSKRWRESSHRCALALSDLSKSLNYFIGTPTVPPSGY